MAKQNKRQTLDPISALQQLVIQSNRILEDIDSTKTGWYYQFIGAIQNAERTLREHTTH